MALPALIGSGYKISMLASLTEGETLIIGAKEVEVMGVISADTFATGRCFQEARVEDSLQKTTSCPSHRPTSKPFCPPSLSGRGEHLGSQPREQQICRPRHDPQAAGV